MNNNQNQLVKKIENIKSHFKKRPSIMVGLVIILAIVLPILIGQVLKQQEVRQHADTAPAISLSFNPQSNSAPLLVGSSFTVDVLLNTAPGEDIGALKLTLDYDATILSAPSVVSQSTGLQIIQTPNESVGKFGVVMVNPNLTPQVTGSNLKVLTLQFTAKSIGKAQISLEPNILATAATYNTYAPVSNSTTIFGSFTVTSTQKLISTPTPVKSQPLNPRTVGAHFYYRR